MAKVDVDYRDYFPETVDGLAGGGLLLVSVGADGKPNVMTIGWGILGTIWRRPIFMVLVRPSRHTYSLLEQTGDFTINLMPQELSKAVAYCGDVSGRDHDKFTEQGLKLSAGKVVKAPVIDQALLQFECRAVQKTDIDANNFDPAIINRFYAQGDFHRLYFGQIMATHAEESFAKK